MVKIESTTGNLYFTVVHVHQGKCLWRRPCLLLTCPLFWLQMLFVQILNICFTWSCNIYILICWTLFTGSCKNHGEGPYPHKAPDNKVLCPEIPATRCISSHSGNYRNVGFETINQVHSCVDYDEIR